MGHSMVQVLASKRRFETDDDFYDAYRDHDPDAAQPPTPRTIERMKRLRELLVSLDEAWVFARWEDIEAASHALHQRSTETEMRAQIVNAIEVTLPYATMGPERVASECINRLRRIDLRFGRIDATKVGAMMTSRKNPSAATIAANLAILAGLEKPKAKDEPRGAYAKRFERIAEQYKSAKKDAARARKKSDDRERAKTIAKLRAK